MSNELTDVRCPCGAEFQADSYDAGFIAGSGMCQNCDAALPPKDICTCPSGDGSLRHPCPAHPASVEQAGGDERAAFRPAQVISYRPGVGEVTIYVAGRVPGYMNIGDTVYVSDRAPVEQPIAALAQPSPVSEALIYACKNLAQITSSDGSGHADIALAVLRMAGVGDDERERLVNEWKAARAWKPSPAQAEAERPPQPERYTADVFHPERPYYMAQTSVVRASDFDEFATQYERIVGALRAELQAAEDRADTLEHRMMGMMTRHFAEAWRNRDTQKALDGYLSAGIAQLEQQRDAALSEVERLRQFERICEGLPQDAIDGGWTVQGIRAHSKQLEEQLKVALARVAELEKQEPVAHLRASDLERLNQPGIAGSAGSLWNGPREGFVPLYAAPVAQAQHSVPELDQLYSMLGAESQVDAAKKIAELIGCRMSRSALTEAQMRRIYENSTEIENERLGFAAFARLMRRAEAVHQIAAAPGNSAQHSVPEGWMLVECGIWTQEQVDEMQKTVARFRNSEFVDDRALAMAVADAGQCKAPEISLAELLAAAPGKEGV